MPEALIAFLEATGFEDAVRKAVSLGGDSDTQAAITGSVAEGAWGVPPEIAEAVRSLLPPFLADTLARWEQWRGQRSAE